MSFLPILPKLINSKHVPPEVRNAFRKAEEAHSREQDLWRVFVAINILDACGQPIALRKKQDRMKTVEEAIKWFHSGENTYKALDMAGINPEIVIEVMKKEFPLTYEK